MALICPALWMLHLDNLRVLEVADSLIPSMLPSCGTSNQKGVKWRKGGDPGPAASHHLGTGQKGPISGSIPHLWKQTVF